MSGERVYLYDSTLRDGAQTQGVDFTPADKAAIAEALDRLGIDYVEGGWPGANPTDDAFFGAPPALHRARLAAFGMTRRSGRCAADDPGLAAVLAAGAPVVTLVGKTWDFHAEVALGVGLAENVDMIGESIAHAAARCEEVIFDAEHFFDGYKANPGYALDCVRAALEAGARWIVLCDTNGGTLPHEVERIVGEVLAHVPGERLGIHCHDDTGNAVANSLLAVRAGVRHVQGTLNGLGERCGNANLVSILPSLILKMGFTTGVTPTDLTRLTHVSRLLDERLNRQPNRRAPYVGESAFAHKGGLHVSAVEKDPRCYEHIAPELVGNRRHIIVSDQAGRSNVLARLREIGLELEADDPRLAQMVRIVKEREGDGYAYDGAEASFELLARRVLGDVPEFFRITTFRVIDERRWDDHGRLVTLSEATVKLEVEGETYMTVAEGNGPVNALDAALRKVLTPVYPELAELRLVDYKVRILTPEAGTAAVTRVMIESTDGRGEHWNTVGVSGNVIDASFHALYDSITYLLLRHRLPGRDLAS
ncbi:citramalate synthase [Inmirania thermothiophila]|uniref:Citramalate synthase n=1 Tax=Inmirania thermothiophila TaxID=1750597 RepID=A0A3N1Y8M9_9GAMM|nr:citramalate synthase [Inmirania thermothiophila]ROR35166.1 2-isopropylmalate synthase [Inmirania thermothiophila]